MLVWILAATAWAGTCDRLYWADNTTDAIRSLDATGTVRDVVRVGVPGEDAGPWGLWVHGEHVYWGDFVNDTVSRAPIEGGAIEVLAEGVQGPFGVAVHPSGEELYWADQDARAIRARSLGGGTVRDVAVEVGGGSGRGTVDLATDGRWLYFTELSSRSVQRVRPDGTGLATLVVEPEGSQPTPIVVDRAGERLFWGDFTRGVVRRSALDGSGAADVATYPGAHVRGVAIDGVRRHLYVGLDRVSLRDDGTLDVSETIVRIDLETGGEHTIVERAGSIHDLFWFVCEG